MMRVARLPLMFSNASKKKPNTKKRINPIFMTTDPASLSPDTPA